MSSDRVPSLLLERLARGELEEPKRTEVLERLKREPGGEERLAELEASDRAILAEIPPARFRADLDAALQRPLGPRWLSVALPAAALAAAVLALFPIVDPEGPENPVEVTRLKGDPAPSLNVFRDGERLGDGALARAGEVLSFSVRAPEPVYAALVAIDGAGVVSVIEPGSGARPIRVEPGRPLPSAYALDDAPDFERFFLITADAPFDVDAARNALAAGDALPAGLAVDRFEVKKSP